MATADLTCWNCGEELREVPLPLARGEECPRCVANQRACRGCTFYDADAHNACREPMADLVGDKEKANTCDYFRTGMGGTATGSTGTNTPPGEADAARARLKAAFGTSPDAGDKPRAGSLADEANALKAKGESEADAARKKLEALFGKKED